MEQIATIFLAMISSLFTFVVIYSDRQLKRWVLPLYAVSVLAFVCIVLFRAWQGI